MSFCPTVLNGAVITMEHHKLTISIWQYLSWIVTEGKPHSLISRTSFKFLLRSYNWLSVVGKRSLFKSVAARLTDITYVTISDDMIRKNMVFRNILWTMVTWKNMHLWLWFCILSKMWYRTNWFCNVTADGCVNLYGCVFHFFFFSCNAFSTVKEFIRTIMIGHQVCMSYSTGNIYCALVCVWGCLIIATNVNNLCA